MNPNSSITELIARLGHETPNPDGTRGLPWARCPATAWRSALASAPLARCTRARGHIEHSNGSNEFEPHEFEPAVLLGTLDHGPALPPTINEWSAEWEREHPGEPGPVSRWTDGRIEWEVEQRSAIHDLHGGGSWWCIFIRVGNMRTWRYHDVPGWLGSIDEWHVEGTSAPGDDAPVELGRLMQAVDGKK